MKALLDSHSTVLDNVEGEDGISVRKNWKGGLTIGGNVLGGFYGLAYTSYFKVYDASSGGSCKIGVMDGSAVDPLVGQCGFVWANGEVVGVDAFESDAIESAGSIWVWLVTQIGPSGASSSVMTTTDSTAPSGYGYATQSQLLGRVTIASSGSDVVVAAINQDYLKGGEHMAVFFSDCALLEDEG